MLAMSSQASNAKMRELQLPMTRVRTIMKRADNVESIGGDGLFLVAKATELFIHHLTTEAHNHSRKASSLEYKHLAEAVQTSGTMDFLHEIVPRKITVKKFKELMTAKEVALRSSSSESSSDSDSDSHSDTSSESENDIKQEKDIKEEDLSSDPDEDKKMNGSNKSVSSKSDTSNESASEDEN